MCSLGETVGFLSENRPAVPVFVERRFCPGGRKHGKPVERLVELDHRNPGGAQVAAEHLLRERRVAGQRFLGK